jgi:hypothetical protein
LVVGLGTLRTLRQQNVRSAEVRQYHAAYYAYYASERDGIRGKLARALIGAATPREIKHWQRAVSLKHTVAALSAKGSVVDPIGGRFNFGRIDERRFLPFPALYVASDRLTAMEEKLGATKRLTRDGQMELALQDRKSISLLSLSGYLHATIDLSRGEQLQPFLELIRGFSVPAELVKWAKRLKLALPGVVRSLDGLKRELLEVRWRYGASALGVPSNSQIFGELAASAGIEAIFYPSTKSGQECAAVFPQNFANSESYLELDDPPPAVDPPMLTRLDKHTWPQLI